MAIITTPLKFVGFDLKVVANTPMKVSTMCLALVESVFFGKVDDQTTAFVITTLCSPLPAVVSTGRCCRRS